MHTWRNQQQQRPSCSTHSIRGTALRPACKARQGWIRKRRSRHGTHQPVHCTHAEPRRPSCRWGPPTLRSVTTISSVSRALERTRSLIASYAAMTTLVAESPELCALCARNTSAVSKSFVTRSLKYGDSGEVSAAGGRGEARALVAPRGARAGRRAPDHNQRGKEKGNRP